MSDAVSYVSEPATHGKVLLVTTLGDLDVELWSKECPLACRNFLQLCMEGYYDNCMFHRVMKGFMAQTGDPTGSGHGGESANHGIPFADEFHSRLRFTRRGLVGMASNGKDSNQSQFFITLGPCEFLNRRHTLFAKITGDTLYNLTKFSEIEIDDETPSDKQGRAVGDADGGQGHADRPFNPPRILRAEVLLDPFAGTDNPVVPRAKSAPAPVVEKKQKKVKKNLALLSFEEDELVDTPVAGERKSQSKSSHDLLQDDARLSRTTTEQAKQPQALGQDAVRDGAATAAGGESAARATREALSKKSVAPSGSVDEEYMDESQFDAHMRAQLLRKKGLHVPPPASAASASAAAASSAATAADSKRSGDAEDAATARSRYSQLKSEMGLGSVRSQAVRASNEATLDDALLSPLEQRRSKYKTRKQNSALSSREADTLAKLAAFKQNVAAASASAAQPASRPVEPESSAVPIPPVPVLDDAEEAALDAEALTGSAWLGHSLRVQRRPQDFDPSARRDIEGVNFAVVDPRGEEGARELNAAFAGNKRARAGGVAGLQGGNRGMTGVHHAGGGPLEAVRYKSAAELDAEDENARVVQRLLEADAERSAKRSRRDSRSRSRSRSRGRRSRSRSRERTR